MLQLRRVHCSTRSCEPEWILATVFVTPASSSTGRTDEPATKPRPCAGINDTRAAQYFAETSCAMELSFVRLTVIMCFFASRTALSIASVVSPAFPRPTPTLPFLLPNNDCNAEGEAAAAGNNAGNAADVYHALIVLALGTWCGVTTGGGLHGRPLLLLHGHGGCGDHLREQQLQGSSLSRNSFFNCYFGFILLRLLCFVFQPYNIKI